MKLFIIWGVVIAALLSLTTTAQDQRWMFGQNHSLYFDASGPVYGGIPGTGILNNSIMPFYRSNAVCDAAGNLLFFVKLKAGNTVPPAAGAAGANLYKADGSPMDNGNLVTSVPIAGPVHIIKKPGNNSLYFVVYALNNGLLSTTVDMSMNGGQGGVVNNEKGIKLSNWQTIVAEKTVVIQGCDCIWLVVRSRTANEYKSFRITEEGIDLQPVISVCGNLPLINYNDNSWPGPFGVASQSFSIKNGHAGLLKASPDGSRIAACCDGGLEIYKFSKCNGRVWDALLIDTTKTQVAPIYGPISGMNYNEWGVGFYSACFSPDGSKLYATYFLSRHVYQYDLEQLGQAAIMNSKNIVLSNNPMVLSEVMICGSIDTPAMGDLKLAPNGYIYVANSGLPSCDTTNFPFAEKYLALHAIRSPNQYGAACNIEKNSIKLSYLYEPWVTPAGVDFPPHMVYPPAETDTLTSLTKLLKCSSDLLDAGAPGDCYLWNTGATTPSIDIDTAGLYVVQWTTSQCTVRIDSFIVAVPSYPEVALLQQACEGELKIEANQKDGDTTIYDYELSLADTPLRSHSGSTGARFDVTEPGDYLLRIRTASGCDTLITVILSLYSKPDLSVFPADTMVRYGENLQLNASGANLYSWWPTKYLDSATHSSPVAKPLQPTVFTVIGWNEHGCRDSSLVYVNIDYSMPDGMPNAFSPNGDGINDEFRISGITYQRLGVFTVFNRYGQEVFRTTDPLVGWDGRYKGKACDAGTYYYFVSIIYPGGLTRQYKGDVLLLR
jgi:gliding motility-associated-like protein